MGVNNRQYSSIRQAAASDAVARYRDIVKRFSFQGDAAFVNPEIYKFL